MVSAPQPLMYLLEYLVNYICPHIEGRDLAKHFGCKFIETSAKQRINVDEAFSQLVREIGKYNKVRCLFCPCSLATRAYILPGAADWSPRCTDKCTQRPGRVHREPAPGRRCGRMLWRMHRSVNLPHPHFPRSILPASLRYLTTSFPICPLPLSRP